MLFALPEMLLALPEMLGALPGAPVCRNEAQAEPLRRVRSRVRAILLRSDTPRAALYRGSWGELIPIR
jgi:hypothetical protein